MQSILVSQGFVEVSTTLIFALTLGLAIMMSYKYVKKRSNAMLYWSIGIWLFAIGVLLEMLFSFGVYSEFLIAAYLFITALLVEILAIGSMQLIHSKIKKKIYYAYSLIITIFLAYSLYSTNTGNIIIHNVVFGALPLFVIVTSSLATFPAAILLITIAAISYKHTHSMKMLSIISGVVVVSVAGTLYIASIPSFLYYAEFIGILLLWFGFI